MLDVKYRPKIYEEVLGQENIVEILRSIIKNNEGFQQSYVFAGPHGSGKTTLGRIFGRSLICEQPQEGEACGKCASCTTEHNLDFVEFDAATNSGKQDIQKILEEASFSSLQGKKKLFLIDESHRLSKEALDALLKPMEEIDKQGNRKIVCIFCTTELEKMRNTIVSRCAPVFLVKKPAPKDLGNYLISICHKEGILFDTEESLEKLALLSKCHVRDSLKVLALIGHVNDAQLNLYFKLNNYEKLLEIILEAMQGNSFHVLLEELVFQSPPELLYRQTSEIFYEAFKKKTGGSHKLFFLNEKKFSFLVERDTDFLLKNAVVFSEKLSEVSFYTLLNDFLLLKEEKKHHPMKKENTNGKMITSDGFVGDLKLMSKMAGSKSDSEMGKTKFQELLKMAHHKIKGEASRGS